MDVIHSDPCSDELVQNNHSDDDVPSTDVDDVYQHSQMDIKTQDHIVYVNADHQIVETLHDDAADDDDQHDDATEADAIVSEVNISQNSEVHLGAMTTSHMMSDIHEQHTYTIAPSTNESLDEGETITISLEEATEIILQQQGLQGAVQIAPGTYQILTQQASHVSKHTYLSLEIYSDLNHDKINNIINIH